MSDPPLETLDRQRLIELAEAHLEASADWGLRAARAGIEVRSGFLSGLPCRAYRTDLSLEASSERVVRFIADDMFEELPRWNQEFIEGHVVEELHEDASSKAWLMHVFYATPWPLSDREYLYYLERVKREDGVVLVAYQSVDAAIPVRDGFVRGQLAQTVHRVVPTAGGGTRLEHVLAGDIRGAIPRWAQSHLFASGFVAANLRDALAQQRLLDEVAA
jgi:START domain